MTRIPHRINQLAGRIDVHLVVVLAIPFILLAANNEWLFPFGNPTDTWHNNAYFFEDGNDFPSLYTIYKSTRLSWLLKGMLVHRVFEPLTAYYVLHLSMFAAMLAAFYLIVKILFNRHIAFIASAAFGTYSQFHSVISFEWDYQTHDGMLNLLLTLLFMLLAAKSARWRLWLMLAGAAWASAVQTTYVGAYIPVLIVWYLFLNHRFEKHSIAKSIGYFILGGVAVTLLYCIASYLLGGPFWFFLILIMPIWSFGFVGGYRFLSGYWLPLGHVLHFAKGLVVPLCSTLIALTVMVAIVARRQRGKTIDAVMITTGCLVIAFATHFLFHLVGHGHLTNDHMIAYISPIVFLGMAGVYAYVLRMSGLTVPVKAATTGIFELAVLTIFCGALIVGQDLSIAVRHNVATLERTLGIPDQFREWLSIQGLELMILFALAVLIVNAFLARSRGAKGTVAALGLSGFLALANIHNTSIPVASYAWNFECGYFRDQYAVIQDAYARIRAFDPGMDLRLWYRNNETVPHPDARCAPERSRFVVSPGINMTTLYGGIFGFRFFTFLAIVGREEADALRTPENELAEIRVDYDGLVEEYLKTTTFATISKRRLLELEDRFRMAVLSSDPKDHEKALRTLRANAFKLNVLDRSRVRHGVVSVDITILEVRKDDRLRARTRL